MDGRGDGKRAEAADKNEKEGREGDQNDGGLPADEGE
jgi:hypothetical protein